MGLHLVRYVLDYWMEEMRGKGGKQVKGAVGLEHIGGSEGLDG